MDSQPSFSRVEDDPLRIETTSKRQRRSFQVSEKQMVLNAYKYVYKQKAEEEYPIDVPNKDECVKTTAEILGISPTSVYRILKESKENNVLAKPKKPGPKPKFKKVS